ncbi:unnamed protein product, partial [Brassicogethes aeneus]
TPLPIFIKFCIRILQLISQFTCSRVFREIFLKPFYLILKKRSKENYLVVRF